MLEGFDVSYEEFVVFVFYDGEGGVVFGLC